MKNENESVRVILLLASILNGGSYLQISFHLFIIVAPAEYLFFSLDMVLVEGLLPAADGQNSKKCEKEPRNSSIIPFPGKVDLRIECVKRTH